MVQTQMIESLETRKLLSATVTAHQVGGTLIVQGTNNADSITVTEDLLVAGQVGVADNAASTEVGLFTGVTNVIIVGKSGDDSISFYGQTVSSQIFGGNGVDQIDVHDFGNVGSVVFGGNDGDTILVDATNGTCAFTTVFGDSGDDIIVVSSGNALVSGGSGDDTLIVVSGNSVVSGDSGNDDITVISGSTVVSGGPGNDTIVAPPGSVVVGGPGHDTITYV